MLPLPLHHLASEDAQYLEQVLEKIQVSENEKLFSIGDSADGFYIVDSGTIRIELDNLGGSETDTENVLGFIESGSIFGELAILDSMPRSASAIANTSSTLRKLSSENLNKLCEDKPQIYASIVGALGKSAAEKLRATNTKLAQVIFTEKIAQVDVMVQRAKIAQREFEAWEENRIDAMLAECAQLISDKSEELATMIVQETRMGKVEDKVAKNRMASLGVLQTFLGKAANGLLEYSNSSIAEYASPVGIVFGLVPVTNPVSTFIFKTLIALKGRNALILSPNRIANNVCNYTGELIQSVLTRHGAPEHILQWIKERNSRQVTNQFMSHPDIGLILATGGASMVRAAYSSGNPSIGVGQGNAPVLVCEDANLFEVAAKIIVSKSFDNGLICGSEHNIVVLEKSFDELKGALESQGAAVLTEEEVRQFEDTLVSKNTHRFGMSSTGKSAQSLAEKCNISRPFEIKLIVVPTSNVSSDNQFACEKMAPVLGLFTVKSFEEGIEKCKSLLEIEGTGHTAVIHSNNETYIKTFALNIPVSRILVNSPAAQGVVGATTDLTPSFTLGCGTFGGNSTTDNVGYRNLLNIKRVATFNPKPGFA